MGISELLTRCYMMLVSSKKVELYMWRRLRDIVGRKNVENVNKPTRKTQEITMWRREVVGVIEPKLRGTWTSEPILRCIEQYVLSKPFSKTYALFLGCGQWNGELYMKCVKVTTSWVILQANIMD